MLLVYIFIFHQKYIIDNTIIDKYCKNKKNVFYLLCIWIGITIINTEYRDLNGLILPLVKYTNNCSLAIFKG